MLREKQVQAKSFRLPRLLGFTTVKTGVKNVPTHLFFFFVFRIRPQRKTLQARKRAPPGFRFDFRGLDQVSAVTVEPFDNDELHDVEVRNAGDLRRIVDHRDF